MLKNITNTLAQTLKCHLILRHANFKNKPKQTKISKENINKHIPIITNDSIKLISEIRLQKLWEQYTALTVESDFPSFTNTIIKTASNIKLQNTQKWSIAPMLGDFLWKDLGCSIERNVSIFNFNTKINLFQPSPYIKEKTDPPWTLKAFTNTSHNPTEIKHYLTLALYATHINNTTTFMFIPEPTDADMEYYTLLRHHYVGFLANWPEKTFYLQSHTDNKLYSDHKINLVCIAQKSASLNLKQKNTLNNISLQIFKTIPTYTITKPNTKLNTEARQTLSEMISGKINKYLTQQMQTNPEKLPTRTNTKKINSITLKFILQQFPIKQIISDKLLKNIEEACKDYHPCKDKEVITDNDIDEAKKFLRKTLVISQTDKNNGCLVAECPLGYYLRLEKELLESPNYQGLTDNHSTILNQMKEEYMSRKFNEITAWGKGYLPEVYCNPKQKDLNKSRIISAANALPHKKLLKSVGGILHWLLQKIPTKNFTLHNMMNLPNILEKKLIEITDENSKIGVIQIDVEQMYTNLQHSKIKKSINWLLNRAKRYDKKRGNKHHTINISFNKPYIVRWGPAYGEGKTNLNLKLIEEIITYDLKHTYTTLGGKIYKQINICCAYDENTFLKNNQNIAPHMLGIRQIDDAMIVISYPTNDTIKENNALQFLNNFTDSTNPIYKDGLTCKKQKINYDIANDTYNLNFIGTHIQIKGTGTNKPLIQMQCKNWSSLIQRGEQTFLRLIQPQSYTPSRIKNGTIIGEIVRHKYYTNNPTLLHTAICKLCLELLCLGYKKTYLYKLLLKIKYTYKWKFLKKVSQWLKNLPNTNLIPFSENIKYLSTYTEKHMEDDISTYAP